MSLTNSYTGGSRRCSTQKTACTLPCKEMQVQFQRLAGHGQWSWRQWFGAWGLSCNLKQKSLRKHNTKCRDSEVHQHIQALSRIWTKCGKKQFGKHISHLPACDAESVCTARSQNMSWLALMLPVTKCREANILQSIYWRFPNRFGGSQQSSIHLATEAILRSEAWHTNQGNLVSTIGDAAGLPVFAKEDTTAQAISPHNAKRNESRGFPASWGSVSKETESMEAQRPEPEAACDPRVAARFDFASLRLVLRPHYNTSWQGSKPNVLSSFTHSRSQVN